ncbi:N-acetylmuramoyl-L-alanine amidase [Novosphingobium sp. KACC 22771]|uniref:N-acetylmuramoyl-L-alanine amidase n=1 Tax=Novosphingobium sp. KACC 22771 TaxID=3025670 RepID=UPI002365F279|nr:N-acetylmuramoyl-L-alanine amidase [Novosphingobium sp. KACC 22771]WDF73680.1 N-acetylmuramoyl-L-alanine amidase [Novosphingobium sp. KACC 22771]
MHFNKDGWGDTPDIKKSPNFYTSEKTKEIIILHYTAGYKAPSAINHFLSTDAKASAHFVIETDGAIVQMVSINKGAWHAGGGIYDGRKDINHFSIGIEIVNPGYHYKDSSDRFLNWQKKVVDPKLLAPFPGMIKAFDPWVGSETYWPEYPNEQLDALENLIKSLIQSVPTIHDIVGHKDVDTLRKKKVDPGPAFPMLRFRKLIDDRSEEKETQFAMMVKTQGGTLNVRGGPGTSFETLTWGPLQSGDLVTVISRENEWYNIKAEKGGATQEGWVYAKFLVSA